MAPWFGYEGYAIGVNQFDISAPGEEEYIAFDIATEHITPNYSRNNIKAKLNN